MRVIALIDDPAIVRRHRFARPHRVAGLTSTVSRQLGQRPRSPDPVASQEYARAAPPSLEVSWRSAATTESGIGQQRPPRLRLG
jgi:hypothetical protein